MIPATEVSMSRSFNYKPRRKFERENARRYELAGYWLHRIGKSRWILEYEKHIGHSRTWLVEKVEGVVCFYYMDGLDMIPMDSPPAYIVEAVNCAIEEFWNEN